jgi:hypothetical protein
VQWLLYSKAAARRGAWKRNLWIFFFYHRKQCNRIRMITILEMNLAPLNRWQLVFITISSLLLIFNFLFYLGVLERTKLPLLHTHACTSTDLLDRAVRLSDCLAQAQQDVSLQKHGHFAQKHKKILQMHELAEYTLQLHLLHQQEQASSARRQD